ncbi:MAG: hypothetical protein R3284_05005, partial [Rubricoccaceae bacterium]|nr:hypothetical protein [Rubricoccaceae bacterium]
MYRLTLVTLLLLPSLALAQWPTTEWVVECMPDVLASLGDDACDDSLPDSPAGLAKMQLEGASEWLQARDFLPPTVEIDNGLYVAWIANNASAPVFDEDWGWYDWDTDTGKVLLRASFWEGFGDHAGYGSFLAQQIPHSYTAVHLLFHAIQQSYIPGAWLGTSERAWIWEGTAEFAVLYWYFDQTGIQPEDPPQILSDPRHVSRDTDVDYDAYLFWVVVNRLAEGGSIFLQVLFEADLVPDRGITGLHDALLS